MDYDRRSRVAATESFLTKKLVDAALALESDLAKQVVKYTGSEKSKAKVEKHGGGVRVRLWIHLPDANPPRADFDEIAEILIGPGFANGQHRLVPNMYVAVKDITL